MDQRKLQLAPVLYVVLLVAFIVVILLQVADFSVAGLVFSCEMALLSNHCLAGRKTIS